MSRPAVAVIVPVLGRPASVRPLMASLQAATPQPYRLLFVASADDEVELAELRAAGADYIVADPKRGTWACKINDGFRATTEPWVLAAADDLRFRPGWFERALEWADASTCVIGTNDICNPRVMCGQHATHALFRRDYVERFGTIDEPGLVMHEGYRHDYADNEAMETAVARGVYVHAFDAIVEHMHPLVGKAPDDATYRLGRKGSAQGAQLFRRRKGIWKSKPTRISLVAPPERAVVVTASYGGYDAGLHVPVAQDMAVDFVCFTEDERLVVPEPWRVIVRSPVHEEPRMAAKIHKMLPDAGCPDVVWVDASHEITSPSFVREALASRHDGVAAFRHPRRDCIYDEFAALLGAENQNGLYFDRPLREQAALYREQRYPTRAGLFACGVVAWDLRDARTAELGRAWFDECERFSHQDQVEFPVVCRRLGIESGIFPVDQIEPRLSRGKRYLANRWLRIWPHNITVRA